MKQPAITVKQPWASLIMEGVKDIENRTWKCPQKYIGKRVLIHAGMDNKTVRCTDILTENQFNAIPIDKRLDFLHLKYHKNQFGAIIGSVEIVDCVINHPSIWAEKSENNCSEKCRSKKCEHFIEWGFQSNNDCRSCKLIGQSYEIDEIPKNCPYNMKMQIIYNWVLANPIKFPEPIPCKGKLSFWDYPNISAEPEEEGGDLFCHCQIPVSEEDQVMSMGGGDYRCRYCGGKWYK